MSSRWTSVESRGGLTGQLSSCLVKLFHATYNRLSISWHWQPMDSATAADTGSPSSLERNEREKGKSWTRSSRSLGQVHFHDKVETMRHTDVDSLSRKSISTCCANSLDATDPKIVRKNWQKENTQSYVEFEGQRIIIIFCLRRRLYDELYTGRLCVDY